MGFQEVQSLDADTAISLGGFNKKAKKDNPTTITGYFLGSKTVESPKAKTGFSKLHIFQTDKGNIGVWGKTDLDAKLRNAPVGALVRATFVEIAELKGGNTMYKYKVEVDKDNAIEVASSGVPDGYTEDDGYTDEDSEDTIDELPPARATAPRSPIPSPTTATQSRVKEMLAAKGRTATT